MDLRFNVHDWCLTPKRTIHLKKKSNALHPRIFLFGPSSSVDLVESKALKFLNFTHNRGAIECDALSL